MRLALLNSCKTAQCLFSRARYFRLIRRAPRALLIANLIVRVPIDWHTRHLAFNLIVDVRFADRFRRA